MERRSLFMLIVLVLPMVIPMATSADRGLATVTPTPMVATATPTPIITDSFNPALLDGAQTAPLDTSTVQGRLSRYTEALNAQCAEGALDGKAMKGFRSDLLSMVDALDELSPIKSQASVRAVARELFEQLSDQELCFAQVAFEDAEYQTLKDGVETLKSVVLTLEKSTVIPPEKKSSAGNEGLGPSLSSFTIVPTPTPGSSGIEHANHQTKNTLSGPSPTPVVEDIFLKDGADAFRTPGYPTDVCVVGAKDRVPAVAMFVLFQIHYIAQAIQPFLKFSCSMKVVVCPAPGSVSAPTNVASCIAKIVADTIVAAIGVTRSELAFCNAGINSAEIEGTFNNTQVIHADLIDHDDNLVARANAIDQFLFDFRNLNLRARIEANLASPEDDPISLFALPSNICIKEDPQPGEPFAETIAPEPIVPLTQETLRRCGLLEVVSDTVKTAIDMNSLAGQDVNNAEAEFHAALEHYRNKEWKLAYARFRKAFREAVRP